MEVIRPATATSPSDETHLPPHVEAYLDRLAAEQNKFLGAVAAANSMLETTGLAGYASAHARLNQEFLDAQRALLKRRAQRQATARRIDARLAHPSNGVALDEAFDVAHDDLVRLIDGAFEPVGPDVAVMRGQLRSLLDGWWTMETTADGGEAIARRQPTGELPIVATVADGPPAPSTPALAPPPAGAPAAPVAAPEIAPDPTVPADVTDEAAQYRLPDIFDDLESASHHDLASMLATLLDTLGGPVVDPDTPPPPSMLVQTGDAPQLAFDGFWGSAAPVSAAPARSFHPSQMLVPSVFVIALISLVLALVG